jgi:hypothetical protein
MLKYCNEKFSLMIKNFKVFLIDYFIILFFTPLIVNLYDIKILVFYIFNIFLLKFDLIKNMI